MVLERMYNTVRVGYLDSLLNDEDIPVEEYIKYLKQLIKNEQKKGVINLYVTDGTLYGEAPETDLEYDARVKREGDKLKRVEEKERKELERLKKKYEGG